jgi:hypothetical protein
MDSLGRILTKKYEWIDDKKQICGERKRIWRNCRIREKDKDEEDAEIERLAAVANSAMAMEV